MYSIAPYRDEDEPVPELADFLLKFVAPDQDEEGEGVTGG